MSSNTPSNFIGREAELGQIRQLIETQKAPLSVVFISGQSGIGKTRLLQEVVRHCSDLSDVEFIEKIDCYETSAHSPYSIYKHLAEKIGYDSFKNFHRSFQAYDRARLASGEDSASIRHNYSVFEAFKEDYRQYTQSRKVVLILDTVEVALRSRLWDDIIYLLPSLTKTVVLLAGQKFGDTEKLREKPQEGKPQAIEVVEMPLGGLGVTEVDEYLKHQFEENGLRIDKDLKTKISILTSGRPVLLTLAVEWLKRGMPVKELDDISSADILKKTKEELNRLKQNMEKALVESILHLSDSVDQALLQMAWIYRRFDIDILELLFSEQSVDTAQILSVLKDLPFTRILPNGVCVLHDNVRDLINQYDWPMVDPNGTFRLELDQKMAEFYKALIEKTRHDMDTLRDEVGILLSQDTTSETSEKLEQFAFIETQRWILEAENLFYMFRSNPREGARTFVELFEEATISNRDSRELLVSEVKDQTPEWWNRLERLSPNDWFDVKIRVAKDLADDGKISEAYSQFEKLKDSQSAVGENLIALYIQLGNAAVRLTGDDENYFSKALSLSQAAQMPLWIVRSEHALAWFRRLQGRWSDSIQNYQSGLRAAEQIADIKERQKLEPLLENGLAYIYHLQGNYEDAETHCQRAIEILKTSNARKQLGRAYSTLGEIMTGQDRYDEALGYYNQALNIFEEQQAWEMMAIVYRQMAYSRWCHGATEPAMQYIQRSQKLARDHNISFELPSIYLCRGLIVWADDFAPLENAEKFFRMGVDASRQFKNGQMLLENLVNLLEVKYRSRDFAELENCAVEMVKEVEERKLDYPLLLGRMERIQAEAACDIKEYDTALSHYARSIPLIAQHGGYGPYLLSTELEILSHTIRDLPPALRKQWYQRFITDWSALPNIRAKAYSEIRNFLEECQASSQEITEANS